jgi:hypothetical protein
MPDPPAAPRGPGALPDAPREQLGSHGRAVEAGAGDAGGEAVGSGCDSFRGERHLRDAHASA